MLMMMCASSKIIHKRLEAVVEAIRGQIENKEVSSNLEHHCIVNLRQREEKRTQKSISVLFFDRPKT